ncbi:MAG: DUF4397 domain-containing protein [Mucilaginibacter sp.]
MKTQSNFKTPKTLTFALFILLSAVVLALSSCSKNGDNVSVAAYIKAVNSAQASAPQDFYVDNNKVNSSGMAYTQTTGYVSVGSGTHQAQFKTTSTTTVNTAFSLNTSPGAYYTVFYTDDNSATTCQDDRTTPQSGNARVRFINVSSALTGNVDFATSTGTTVVSKLTYKTASAYNEVAAASTFKLYASGSSTVLLSIPVVLQAGKIYTVFISGSTSATITYTLIAEN